MEIGNLACRNSEAARRLIRLLPQHLLSAGYRWVVFTGTRSVRGIVRIFNAPLVELCRADAARAADTGDDWGRYYNSDPRVLAGYLPNAIGSGAPAQTEYGH